MVASDFSRGNQFLRNRQFEEAVAAYRSAIGHNPDFYLAHHNLGEALEQLGRWEEAIAAYQRAVELKPEAAWSHLNLSRVLRQVGRVEEAEKAGDRAVEVEPKLVGAPLKIDCTSVKTVDDFGVETSRFSNFSFEEKTLSDYYTNLEQHPKSTELYLKLAKFFSKKHLSNHEKVALKYS